MGVMKRMLKWLADDVPTPRYVTVSYLLVLALILIEGTIRS